MVLSQKETDFLKDLKNQEEICIQKYQKYSGEACDAQLKNLFSQLQKTEVQHLDTINKMMGGTVPPVSGSGQSDTAGMTFKNAYGTNSNEQNKKHDCYLCTDALSTEKHVSAIYNTSVFEFKDAGMRNVLNHIQTEEQKHGEVIYNYMAQNGMYS